MPRKVLVDLAKLRKEVRKKSKFVETERASINPENNVVEKLLGMESAYDIVLDYLEKCPKYDSSGRKI